MYDIKVFLILFPLSFGAIYLGVFLRKKTLQAIRDKNKLSTSKYILFFYSYLLIIVGGLSCFFFLIALYWTLQY